MRSLLRTISTKFYFNLLQNAEVNFRYLGLSPCKSFAASDEVDGRWRDSWSILFEGQSSLRSTCSRNADL